MMNTPLILKVSAVLLLGGFHGFAEKVEKVEKKEARETKSASNSTSIGSSVSDGKGTVTYGGKEVWKGKVKDSLNALSKAVDDYPIAAAFDGKKLVWENVQGAGKQLEPDLRELLKKQKKLLK